MERIEPSINRCLRGPAGLDSVFCIMHGNSFITGLALVIDNQNYIYT